MSSNIKKVLKLKSTEQRIVMMKGWHEIARIKKRQTVLVDDMAALSSKMTVLNKEDSYLSAELSEIAIRHANYLELTIKNVQDEQQILGKKQETLNKQVTVANARIDAFDEMEKDVRLLELGEKQKEQFEIEMLEATGRKINERSF